ncbi:hypothetical protein CupriaWKF_08270 [Cupriavidus sp. WKF15]|uniref:hypothetical protein n=1 Tax=Cupriavidus sp. WKF15 TaxID=3032282 RepID=UPI0023E0EABA|nr:hypothetical protein [Cupriavidus sp. WKF15]WER47525.1 hypothetical protein CupriaWKF_08270 [Cupriavidus sp. WKF15]
MSALRNHPDHAQRFIATAWGFAGNIGGIEKATKRQGRRSRKVPVKKKEAGLNPASDEFAISRRH